MTQKLLIVEDDLHLINIYRTKLAKGDLTVEIATDGEQALSVLQSFKPDLILLDLVMPRKDGFQFLEELRHMPEYRKTPIIVATNLGQKPDIHKANELGVVDYIVKSDLSLDQLIDRIHAALHKHR